MQISIVLTSFLQTTNVVVDQALLSKVVLSGETDQCQHGVDLFKVQNLNAIKGGKEGLGRS